MLFCVNTYGSFEVQSLLHIHLICKDQDWRYVINMCSTLCFCDDCLPAIFSKLLQTVLFSSIHLLVLSVCTLWEKSTVLSCFLLLWLPLCEQYLGMLELSVLSPAQNDTVRPSGRSRDSLTLAILPCFSETQNK